MLIHIFLMNFLILINWTSSFPILGVSDVLIFIIFLYKFLWPNSVDPDQTPRSAASDLWSGSALFAYVPKMVREAYMG